MICKLLDRGVSPNSRSLRVERRLTALGSLCIVAALASACVTVAGGRLSDIEPQPPEMPPTIEQTVGTFSFHLDGGKMISSNKAGRNINEQILSHWKRRGFIASERYVKSSRFSGSADYNLTLSGHQEGESSVAMQVVSGLTLLLFPYSVNTQLDLVYTLEHVKSGRKFEAKASDGYRTVTQLLLFPITPFAMGGSIRTHTRLADHLYNQLASQGAFDPSSWQDLAPGSPAVAEDAGAAPEAVKRLRVLEQLRTDGLLTDEEYKAKKTEILRDL